MTIAQKAIAQAEALKRQWWDFLRDYYAVNTPAIMAEETWRWAIPVNEIDWRSLFSPIEDALWSEMRQEGVVLYPQYPVAGVFLDFAHPKVRVAVECDGAAWHADRLKDYQRDEKLRALGWTVFRITGSQCMQQTTFDEDGGEAELGRPKLLLRELAARYGLSGRAAKKAEA
jgi:very-short-patch-repair endonuclease